MQTLAQQQAAMNLVPTQAMKGSIGFMDVVGADSVSSFRMAKQCTIATDKASVSIAGENNVLPGSGVAVVVNLADVLLSTHESGLAFQLTCSNGGYVKNAAKLFEATSMVIGGIDISFQNGKYYQTQVLNTSSLDELKPYAFGELATYKVDKVSNVSGQQLNITNGANPAAVADFSGIHEYVSSLYANWKRQAVGAQANEGADHIVYCFVPFHHIIPSLRDMPALYQGLGQKLQLNFTLVPSAEALMHCPGINGGAAPTYTISQAHGIYVYSILDAPRRDMILRSNVSPIPVVKSTSNIAVAQQTHSLQVPVSRGQFVRRLLISLHHKTPSIEAAAATNALAQAHYFAQATGKAKGGPLNYCPKFGLEFLQIQVGSQTFTFRQQQLKFLQAPHSGQPTPYEDIVMFNHNYCLEIDLTRFSDILDAVGSLGGQQDQVTINWQYSDALVMPGQELGANGLLLNLANFYTIINVETIQYAQCQSGIYSMI